VNPKSPVIFQVDLDGYIHPKQTAGVTLYGKRPTSTTKSRRQDEKETFTLTMSHRYRRVFFVQDKREG